MTTSKIDAAFDESGLGALGYTCHLRSSDDGMRVYSCTGHYAALRLFIKGGEVRCTVFDVLPQSMMRVEIGDISFPHPQINRFVAQIDELHNIWLNSDWCQR